MVFLYILTKCLTWSLCALLLISKAVKLSIFSATFWNTLFEKWKAAKVKNPLVFLPVLCSEFSCQIRWQLWEESSLICIHVIEVMLSVLAVCREYCWPVTYSGIQFEQTTTYLFPQMLPKWSQPVFPCCFFESSVAVNFIAKELRVNSDHSSL